MKNNSIAFVTRIYTDENFDSGGIKLNFILLENLKRCGYKIDLFCNKIISNSKNICTAVYKLNEFESKKENYDCILSDKAFVASDITYIHDHSYPYRIKMMSGKFFHFFYKFFKNKHHRRRVREFLNTKQTLADCKKVIVSSSILKQDLIENYEVDKNKIEIIPPPIEKYKINREKNNIFTFGISALGFSRKGGYLTLFAINRLKKTKNKFKVIFIYKSNNLFVKFLIAFLGLNKYCEFIAQQQNMEKFYNSIDCLLMPSLIEPFGMVSIEALSTGCPVITAAHCGVSDYIKDGENGYLYNKNSSKELALAMLKMLETNQQKYDYMQKQSINSVQNLYTENFIKKYLSILNIK